jgi:hypothetical protein
MTTVNVSPLKVQYVILDASGCPRKVFDLTQSGLQLTGEYVDTYGAVMIPIDPVTALRLKLATAEELGVSDAFASTLALLHP